MILTQHLDIDGVAFDIAIRKPPPVDEAGGKELDRWMRVIIGVLELEAGQPLSSNADSMPIDAGYSSWSWDGSTTDAAGHVQ